MDGLFHGKPYKMDDLFFFPLFLETSICVECIVDRKCHGKCRQSTSQIQTHQKISDIHFPMDQRFPPQISRISVIFFE